MDREQLMSEVKTEYARIADLATRADFVGDAKEGMRNEVYYENLLQDVLHGIENGKFDDYRSGIEIVEAVANDKSRLF